MGLSEARPNARRFLPLLGNAQRCCASHSDSFLYWSCSAARTGPDRLIVDGHFREPIPYYLIRTVPRHGQLKNSPGSGERRAALAFAGSNVVSRPGFSRFGSYGAHEVAKNHHSQISHLYPGTPAHVTSNRSSFWCNVR